MFFSLLKHPTQSHPTPQTNSAIPASRGMTKPLHPTPSSEKAKQTSPSSPLPHASLYTHQMFTRSPDQRKHPPTRTGPSSARFLRLLLSFSTPILPIYKEEIIVIHRHSHSALRIPLPPLNKRPLSHKRLLLPPRLKYEYVTLFTQLGRDITFFSTSYSGADPLFTSHPLPPSRRRGKTVVPRRLKEKLLSSPRYNEGCVAIHSPVPVAMILLHLASCNIVTQD
ncbi:hypothetical protein J3E68DRAFT_150762 [Trichoderma sp. SZMC 28012]